MRLDYTFGLFLEKLRGNLVIYGETLALGWGHSLC